MMTLEEIRLKQNPVLSYLLIGMGQGSLVAETLFPRLPQVLRGMTLVHVGHEHLKEYKLRRAPGTITKRIDIQFDGRTYTLDQYSVEVPIPRELLAEADTARRLNVGAHLDISTVAMNTAHAVLGLGYELDAARWATDAANYPATNSVTYTAGSKWSEAGGTPYTDINDAVETIRKAGGVRPNTLLLSATAYHALRHNAEVMTLLGSNQIGPATPDQLSRLFGNVAIIVGDAIWVDGTGAAQDVWGNAAILAYAPRFAGAASISLAEPAFGFTSSLEGHPFAEQPYYANETKSWIYGATWERQLNVSLPGAGFLFADVI